MTAAIRIESLSPGQLGRILVQERQAYLGPVLDPQLATDLVAAGPAHAALAGDQVLAAAGVILEGFALPTAWAVLAGGLGRRFLVVHRAVLVFLERFGRPVQTGVEPDHGEGARWARLLGFAPVGPWTDWESSFGRSFERWVRHGGGAAWGLRRR